MSDYGVPSERMGIHRRPQSASTTSTASTWAAAVVDGKAKTFSATLRASCRHLTSMTDQLTTKDVAKLAGITPASVRRYRVRGVFPEPDGVLGSTPWWFESTIRAWMASRRPPGRPRVVAVVCYFCGGPIRQLSTGQWVHAADDYDPFARVHVPRPR